MNLTIDLVRALESKLALLEDKVAHLEDELDRQKERTEFRAPFRIVDANGQPVLEVEAVTGGATARLAAANGTGITLSALDTSFIKVDSGERAVEVGGVDNAHGILISQGGKSYAELTDRYDGRYALRIGDDGKNLLTAGIHDSGRVAITVWEGDNELARLDGGETGATGRMRLGGGGDAFVEAAVAAKDGASGFFLGSGAQSIAELATRASATALRVRDGSGNVAVEAGRQAEGWPGISVRNGATTIAQLRPMGSGSVGTLQLYQGGEPAVVLGYHEDMALGLLVKETSGQRVTAGFPVPNAPQVALSTAEHAIAILGQSDKDLSAGALELSLFGKPQIKLDGGPLPEINMWSGADAPVVNIAAVESSAALSILSAGEVKLNLGRLQSSEYHGLEVFEGPATAAMIAADEEGGFARFKNSAGEQTAFLGNINGGTELSVYHGSGQLVRLGSVQGQAGAGTLELMNGGTPTASLGSTTEKPLPAVRIYDKGQPAFAAGIAGNGIAAMSVYSGGKAVGTLQATPDANSALLIQSGGNVVASVNSIDAPGQGHRRGL